ncbi:MAG: molybdenum cofactor guanylyltransferase [Candidatus Obscuribacter sp.]|jgi:molybdopterin-guanine dinucleotide biosynthesis protein A|nr:molybdenum cofactor guanylyltransferase [Candidatus Obscuribacter sp.]MDQ5964451.1 putative molybdenum cofactor guanylyltransferase [Cyanobacteriota bacterium erpe_2018_sw_39hr_WHONDRS-SW48-000098_B_bin.30]MBK7839531.1 molybdenum cofactor guanylyltransferase [Candidatus Obscuribacter sp.]MBK9202229.1 molybdenum cofactor guanylyltransferase [Candidatus Obscuribacter sp.]MBK9618986.1 molybdenum cofactor guanylyltransferase [Candidatus Obscuribacter sp.]
MMDRDPQSIKKHPDMVETPSRETLPLDLTALILCGGRSKRMGRPKAFLPFGGTTMINHILTNVKDMFAETFLVSNEPESFEDFDVDVVKDILPYRGPLGGILSGLLVSQHSHAFVIACDMPLITPKMIRELCQRRFEHDVVVASHDEGIEPLLGVYSKNCIKSLEESLFNGDLALKDFLSGLNSVTYDLEEETKEGSLPPYFNVNTPQDYSRLVTGGTIFELNSKRID